MSYFNRSFSTVLFSLTTLTLSACQQQYVVGPTQPTEAALVAHAIGNGLTTDLDIPYQQAFENLKTAYRICIAFTREHDLVFTDNKLDTQLEMGTLFGRSDGKSYVYKTTLEKMRDNKTKITLYLPPDYKFAQTRFKQDVKRALGQDKYCRA